MRIQRVLAAGAVVAAGVVPALAPTAFAGSTGPTGTAGSGYGEGVLSAKASTATAATYPYKAIPGTVDGRDVSQYNTVTAADWTTLAGQGVKFALIRATSGYTAGGLVADSAFTTNKTGARAAGLLTGAYAFAIPSQPKASTPAQRGAQQADWLISHGGGWTADGRTLPAGLDLETADSAAPCFNMSSASMAAFITGFSNRYVAQTGRFPLIYSNPSWWTTCVAHSGVSFPNNPLWVAHWQTQQSSGTFTPSAPTILSGFSKYTVWQYANGDYDSGGSLDRDAFKGSLATLTAYAKKADRPADLRVQVAVPKLRRSHKVTLTFTITNKGPFKASNVGFTFPLPKQVTLVQVKGCKKASKTKVHCTFASFAKGRTVKIKVTVKVKSTAKGKANGTATLTESTPDLNKADNKVSFHRRYWKA